MKLVKDNALADVMPESAFVGLVVALTDTLQAIELFLFPDYHAAQ